MDRLHRIRALLGDAAIDKLRNATVMVVGCGAVGSFAVEALARSGVGHLTVVDNDTVAASNINRQLFALESSLDMPKVDVAAARIGDINPDCTVTALNLFWDADTDLDLRPDFVIDAIDSVPSKIALYQWCQTRNIPFISSMGAARKMRPDMVSTAKLSKTSVCPLASKIRKLCRENSISDFPVVFSTECATPQPDGGREFGSVITVTGIFGLYLADFAIKTLAANQ